MEDLEAVKIMAKKHFILDCISYGFLEEFEKLVYLDKKPKTWESVRRRFRKALNKASELGLCDKCFIGTTYYQTSDTLGGKSCLTWNFFKYLYK